MGRDWKEKETAAQMIQRRIRTNLEDAIDIFIYIPDWYLEDYKKLREREDNDQIKAR